MQTIQKTILTRDYEKTDLTLHTFLYVARIRGYMCRYVGYPIMLSTLVLDEFLIISDTRYCGRCPIISDTQSCGKYPITVYDRIEYSSCVAYPINSVVRSRDGYHTAIVSEKNTRCVSKVPRLFQKEPNQ